jgi:subtilisin family serine protease
VDGGILGGDFAIDRSNGDVQALDGVVFVGDGNRPLRVTVDLEAPDSGEATGTVAGTIDVVEMDEQTETALVEVDNAQVRALDDGLVAVEGEASDRFSAAQGNFELIVSDRLVTAEAPLSTRVWTGTTAVERAEVADPSGEGAFDRILNAVGVGGDAQLTTDVQVQAPQSTTVTVATTASTGVDDDTRHLLVGADVCASDAQPCPPADTFRWARHLTVDIQPPSAQPLAEDLLLGADPERWVQAGTSTYELPAELAVVAADGTDAATIADLIADTGGGLVGQDRDLGFYRARYPDANAAEAARRTLDDDARVAAVDNVVGREDIVAQTSSPPWQPVMANQPADDTWHWSQINMPSAWQRTTGSADVRLGIFDGGTNRNHPVLHALVEDYSLSGDGESWGDTQDHGTHVSALACARDATGQEHQPVVGAMQHCSMSVLGLTRDDDEDGDFTEAMTTARNLSRWVDQRGLQVVNMSWTLGPTTHNDCAYDDRARDYERVALRSAMTGNPDTLFVTSAGNCGDQGYSADAGAPAEAASDMANVVAVSATARDDEPFDGSAPLAGYSVPDGTLAAPGGGDPWSGGDPSSPIRSAVHCEKREDDKCRYFNFDYGYKQGTSMASPIVAGIAGLMLDVHPELDGPQLATCLQQAATVSVYGSSEVEEIRAPAALNCADRLTGGSDNGDTGDNGDSDGGDGDGGDDDADVVDEAWQTRLADYAPTSYWMSASPNGGFLASPLGEDVSADYFKLNQDGDVVFKKHSDEPPAQGPAVLPDGSAGYLTSIPDAPEERSYRVITRNPDGTVRWRSEPVDFGEVVTSGGRLVYASRSVFKVFDAQTGALVTDRRISVDMGWSWRLIGYDDGVVFAAYDGAVFYDRSGRRLDTLDVPLEGQGGTGTADDGAVATVSVNADTDADQCVVTVRSLRDRAGQWERQHVANARPSQESRCYDLYVHADAVPLPSGNVSLVVTEQNAARDGKVLRLLTFGPGGERLARTQVPLGPDDRWAEGHGHVVATRDGKVATIVSVERFCQDRDEDNNRQSECHGYRLMVFDADTGSIAYDRVELSSDGEGAWSFDLDSSALAAAPGGIYFHGLYERPFRRAHRGFTAARAEPLPIGKPYAKAGRW